MIRILWIRIRNTATEGCSQRGVTEGGHRGGEVTKEGHRRGSQRGRDHRGGEVTEEERSQRGGHRGGEVTEGERSQRVVTEGVTDGGTTNS